MEGQQSMKLLVSIIVPIYNVDRFLDRCINSLINQSYKQIEIILVDDGSNDSSGQICDDWKEKCSNIKVIHQNNKGLGMARNTGLDNADGDYICFVDSDDYLQESAIELAVDRIDKTNAEVVCYGYARFDSKGKLVMRKIPKLPEAVYRNHDVQEIFLPFLISNDKKNGEDWQLEMSACMALFSSELIKRCNWRFVSEREIISEDIYSLLRLYKNVKSVSAIPFSPYCYCQNSSSLTQTFDADRYDKIVNFYKQSIKLSHECNYSNDVCIRLAEPFLANTISHMKQIAKSDNSFKTKYNAIKEIVSDATMRKIICELYADKEKISRKIIYFLIKNRLAVSCLLVLMIKG